MVELDVKNEISREKIEDTIDNFQRLLTEEGLSEEEMERKIKENLKPFYENLATVIEDVEQTKKEQDKEIESHEEFVRILESISQHLEVKNLIQKEIELIAILKKDRLRVEKFYLTFKSFQDILSLIYSEDHVSSSKKKGKLQYEINIITEDLKEKGIIKR